MSSLYEKLVLLPKRIPVLFQYGTGPQVAGTLIIPAPFVKCLEVESSDKVRHLEHFRNSYIRHNNEINLHNLTTEELFLSFVVASGEGTGRTFKTLLVDEPITDGSLSYVGRVDPIVIPVQTFLDQVAAAEDKPKKAVVVMELMTYLKSTGIPFIKRNPKFRAVVISKCEEFRREFVGELPDLVTACTDLLVSIDVTPAPLISGDLLVLRQWMARLPEKVVMDLQMPTGPSVKGVVYPKTNTVLTSFYPDPVPLQKWVSKYCKEYELGKHSLPLVEIIRYLRVGDYDIYTLLEQWKPSYSSIFFGPSAEDEAFIQGSCKEESPVEEMSCDCRSCKQESRVDELFFRTNRLFCAFLAHDGAEYCDCKRCCYEEALNRRIRELEGQMNTILKRLNLQEEKKENDEW